MTPPVHAVLREKGGGLLQPQEASVPTEQSIEASTMLEKMARAIAVAGHGLPQHWKAYLPEARAALLVIRLPDENMVAAYCEAVQPEYYSRSIRPGHTAMIDAILSEGAGE